MSDYSPQLAESESAGPIGLEFTTKSFPGFDVEYADQGDDIVYHFWPPNDGTYFHDDFAMALEDGFFSILPEDADARADYTSAEAAAAFLRYGENPDSEARPRETYSVRVVGYANNPMADKYLRSRVFEAIQKELES
jgi:hypothetical protein